MATKKAKVAEKEKTASKKPKATKKVTDEQLKRLTELGYVGNGEEEAVKKFLVSFLEKNELEGTDEQDIDSLLDIAELFEVEETEEEEADEETEEEEEEEEEADEETEEVEEEDEDEEEDNDDGAEEEEEEESFAKEEVKEKTKKVAKKEVAVVKRTRNKDFVPFDSGNKDHMKVLKPILDFFSNKDLYSIANVVGGITVYYLGGNSRFTIISFYRAKIDVKKKLIVGAFSICRFKEVQEFIDFIPEKYRDENINHFPGESNICFRGATNDAIFDILKNTELIKVSVERIQGVDKRLGNNRKKLEQSLMKNKSNKKEKVIEKEVPKKTKIAAKEVKKVVKGKKKVKK